MAGNQLLSQPFKLFMDRRAKRCTVPMSMPQFMFYEHYDPDRHHGGTVNVPQ